MIISHPVSPADYEKYFDLRWRILREPWQQVRGSEQDELESSSFHIMICDDNHAILAAGRLHAATEKQAQIRYMAVESTQQGKGIGAVLLKELEHLAKEKGFQSILLHAREIALLFYLKHGYRQLEKSHLLFNSIQHFKMIKVL